jgi:hypothetical protein
VAKFGEPPSPRALAAIPPVARMLPRGTRCWRIYFRGGPYATAWNSFRDFGPTSARFDHHLEPPQRQRRQVMYAAESAATCLAEVFQDSRTIDRARRDPWLAGFELRRAITLLDLRSAWPTRAGASMAINSGPRPRARRWSQAIYEAYPRLDGLYYASSMNANEPAIVLYERATDGLPDRPLFHRALADAALTPAIVRAGARFNYVVV